MLRLLSSAVMCLLVPPPPQPPQPTRSSPVAPPHGLTRQAVLRIALLGAVGLDATLLPAAAADADEIFRGVLQLPKGEAFAPAAGTTAQITLRVVGRNTKGPLGTLDVPLEGATFPVDFAITKGNMREGLPEFIWAEDDIYLKADVVTSTGKVIAGGKSKSKFTAADGTHGIAYVTVEK